MSNFVNSEKKIEHDNAMLLDVQYTRPNRNEGIDDYIYIVWKEIDTGKKYLKLIPRPEMIIYFEKPEFRNHNFLKNYARLDTLIPVKVRYKDIIYKIAEDMGEAGRNRMREIMDTRNYNQLQEFYIYPYVYGADYDCRTWYRYQWKKSFNTMKEKKLTKGFMDIEVDSLETPGFPDPIFNPIDLITIIDTNTKQSYTFMLIGVDKSVKGDDISKEQEAKNKLYEHRLKEQTHYATHPEELEEEAHKMFDETYPGFNYNFYIYKDERKMLVHLFQLINKLNLDTLAVWNISFDIPYIIDRMKFLNLDPTEIICHPDFPSKECYFKKDRHHFDVKNKTDFFRVSSGTVYIDQMITYAAIRKGSSELRRFNLNYIAKKEIGDEKLDYTDYGNIKTVSYNNYLKYVLYNIKDVMLQVGIEEATSDIDTYYTYSYENNTSWEDVFKQTVVLRNVQYESFLEQNIVPGENPNGLYIPDDPDEDDEVEYDEDGNEIKKKSDGPTYEGALVGDPVLNSNFGVTLYNEPSNNIFAFSIDLDMSAFYPYTIMADNIDSSTLIFKVIVPCEQFDVRGGNLKYHGITDVNLNDNLDKESFSGDIGKEIMDNLQTDNIISFCHKWLNLPSINEVYEKVKERKH